MTDGNLIVYHDGSCPLCQREIAHYRRQIGAERLTFVDLSRPAAVTGLDLDHSAAMKRFHVRLPDGTLKSGAAGFIAVWERLPRWLWLARATRFPGALALMERAYGLSLRLRPILARAVVRFARR